jgi:hypothetical protein
MKQHGKIAKHTLKLGTKIDQLRQFAKTMKGEERIKNLVNSWEVKQKRTE